MSSPGVTLASGGDPMPELITMSVREIDRLGLMQRIRERHLTCAKAGEPSAGKPTGAERAASLNSTAERQPKSGDTDRHRRILVHGRTMRRVLPIVLIGGGCVSTAAYTVVSAAVNTAIAGGYSAAQRAMGGCYATCTNGTVCNANTGFCEKKGARCACPAGEICLESSEGLQKCVTPSMTIFSEQQQSRTSGRLVVTPESGVVPSLPAPTPPTPAPKR
jgi:hypothetical protein